MNKCFLSNDPFSTLSFSIRIAKTGKGIPVTDSKMPAPCTGAGIGLKVFKSTAIHRGNCCRRRNCYCPLNDGLVFVIMRMYLEKDSIFGRIHLGHLKQELNHAVMIDRTDEIKVLTKDVASRSRHIFGYRRCDNARQHDAWDNRLFIRRE